MRTPWIWSVSLGRWWNVHVRLHMFFFLFAAFVLYLTSNFQEPHWLGVTCIVAVFLSVLLHELAHVVVARRLGGVAEDIVISPLGGLSGVRVPYEPHSELVALMAGTLMNAAICFICAAAIWFSDPKLPLLGLLQPTVWFLQPGNPSADNVFNTLSILKLAFWINWSLILVNLLPVFPFDGGRSLHAVLTFLWPEFDARQSLTAICRLGKILSAVLLLLAWFRFEPPPQGADGQPPAWFALMLLSIYVYFNSRREELHQLEVENDEDTVFGYDFSQGYTSLERSHEEDAEPMRSPRPEQLGIIGQWFSRRREAQKKRQAEQEAEDERRVDEVLERLHNLGMRNLSAEDRALLDRVSERYRSRQS